VIEQSLIAVLRERASARGVVMAREDVLVDKLKASPEVLVTTLRKLERAGLIEVLTPGYFLVIKLKMWSGTVPGPAKDAPKSGAETARGYSYSFQHQAIDKSKAIAIQDGGPERGAQLLQEILATLGESDPTSFRGVLEHYPASSIRAVLQRVRATPPEKVRKSRTALFRYLLAKTK
jgi:hypothetical protein